MAVRDVTDLVAENRRDFVRLKVVNEGVGQQDVAKPRQGACHSRVDDELIRVPHEDVCAAKPEPVCQAFESVAKRTWWQPWSNR